MKINETLQRIDKIFEDMTPLASVPTEPVESGILAKVSGKVAGIFDIQQLSKYKNVSKEQILGSVGKNYKKFSQNAQKLQSGVQKLKTAQSLHPDDLHGFPDKVVAIAKVAGEDPQAASRVLNKLISIAVEIQQTNPKKNDREKCLVLLEQIEKLAHIEQLSEEQTNAIVQMIFDEEGGFMGTVNNLANAYNKLNPKVGTQ